jgi:hypothetical protein
MKIAVIHEDAATLLAACGTLLSSMAALGHEVNAVAPAGEPDVADGFESLGAEYAMYPLVPNGLTPVSDIGTLLHLKQVLFRIRPDLVLSAGLKPMVYGSLAARMVWVGETKKVFTLADEPGAALDGGGLRGRLFAALAKPMFRAGFRSCDGICFRSARAESFYRGLDVLQPDARTVVVDRDGPEMDRAVLDFMGLTATD